MSRAIVCTWHANDNYCELMHKTCTCLGIRKDCNYPKDLESQDQFDETRNNELDAGCVDDRDQR